MATFVKLGGGNTDDITKVITLAVRVNAANNYMTLESPVGVDYTVPGGKTLYITKAILTSDSIGAGFVVGYGDTGVGNGAAAPTSAIQLTEEWRNSFATHGSSDFSMVAVIPTGKLPYIRQGIVAGDVRITCFGLLL